MTPLLPARGRGRRALTVVVLERVLDVDDVRRFAADPARTFERGAFVELLELFARRHRPVGLEALRAARAGGAPLPERALLVTFDGGWADTADTALPALCERGIPAAAFVPSAAVGRAEPPWPAQVFGAWSEGRLSPDEADALWRAAAPGEPPPEHARWGDPRSLHALVAHLERLAGARRDALLEERRALLQTGGRRLMLSGEELAALAAGGVEVGALEALPDDTGAGGPAEARRALAAHLGGAAPSALAAADGRWTAAQVERARAAGFELLFGGAAGTDGEVPGVIARVALDPRAVTEGGRVSERRLARRLAARSG